MNILYCGDKNMSDGLLLSVMSLTKYVSEPLNIYIMTMKYVRSDRVFEPLDKHFCEKLNAYVKTVNKESSVTLICAGELFSSELPVANLATRFTPYCMLRLYADMVEGIPEKLLYLDTDVLCVGDAAELYNTDMGSAELCGALDRYGSHFFRTKPLRRDYLNSGVLLLNMKRIKETSLFAKCRALCREKKMFMPDQTAIHKLAGEKIILPRAFNEQKKARRNTVFRHFTTFFSFFPYIRKVSVKPWQIESMHKVLHLYEYDDLLEEYMTLRKEFENE